MTDQLLITVAPCIPPYLRQGIPNLDLSPAGIANEVISACSAGANIAHLHVWDERGQPSVELEAFQETVRLIRSACDIIIEGSTGGINTLSAAQRSVSLNADIELASLNPGSVNYDRGVYINSPEDIRYWAERMRARGIKPDSCIFEAGMVANTLALIEAGLMTPPFLYSLILGQSGAIPATPKNLLYLVEALPAQSQWSVVGHGGNDLWTSAMAISMGGHARAGFEDNPFFHPGQPAVSNAQLIERLVRIAREIGREPAAPADTRALLGLPGRST